MSEKKDRTPKATQKEEGFTLEDARQILKEKKEKETEDSLLETKLAKNEKAKPTSIKQGKSAVTVKPSKVKRTAVSVLDILGFNPHENKSSKVKEVDLKSVVESKFKRYYDKLMRMREELSWRLQRRTTETLRYSHLEDQTPAHVLGQHTADGASEQADLELALSFVENEQDLLNEVDAALERIQKGTYGVCERTGEVIDKKRLDALPFTRYSLVGQQQLEKEGLARKPTQRQTSPLFLYHDEDVPFGGEANDEE